MAIARAFAAEPDLLIRDEITSALDAPVQAQVPDRLAAMQRRQGMAMLLITQDRSPMWRMARRVALMQGGRILETGKTKQPVGFARSLRNGQSRIACAIRRRPEPP